MKNLILFVIKVYQRTLSPLASACRFTPSCSQYMHDSIVKHGILRGIFLGTKRILRCNPWGQGGLDPVK